MRRTPRLLALLLLLLASPLAATPALAQYSAGAAGGGVPTQGGLGSGIPGLGGGGGGAAQPSRRPQPPALPGLAARRAPDPIPADPNANLSPNAALFDAINRGDLAGARDAVSRGADLDARNVLNQTPEDAAVDQGRNEILFYLLSARGGAGRSDPSASAGGPPPDTAAATQLSAAARREAARAEAAERRSAATARAQALAAARTSGVSSLPRLWAGNGGAPEPQVGFLGFDAGRPAGAVAPAAIAVSDESPAPRHRRHPHGRTRG